LGNKSHNFGGFRNKFGCERDIKLLFVFQIVAFLEESLDSVMSIIIILALLLGAIMSGIFVCIQVHQETVHLLTVTHNVANKTLHPDLNK
jgi:hypothetical protein